MQFRPLFSSVLALGLWLSTPALAHVGHGDEFQATGGVNRVEVNTDTDALLGIQVGPIQPAADGSGAVLIPATALVDNSDRQLVFVQYEGFYEPVDVVIGDTQGELIEIIEGLSVGEQLVNQGSLSLYAESRKSQAAPPGETASPAQETTAPTTPDNSPGETGADTAPRGVPVAIGVVALVALAAAATAALVNRGRDKQKLS